MRGYIKELIRKRFRIREYESSIKNEMLAGITNYFTIIYAVMLVPEILIEAFPGAVDAHGEIVKNAIVAGNFTASEMLVALTAVAFVVAGFASIFMGMVTNTPFVQGPSIAIGTFVTYTICKGFGYTYNQALAMVFISGILFFVLSATGAEEKIHKIIPHNIKYAVSAGIGFFIAFTGIEKAHIIDYSEEGVHFFTFNLADKNNLSAVLAIAVVIFIVVLMKRHVHGAIFVGKIVCIILAIPLGLVNALGEGSFGYSIPITSLAFKLDFHLLTNTSTPWDITKGIMSVVIIIFAICIMDIFETMTLLIAMGNYAGVSFDKIKDKKNMPKILEVDAVTTSVGALLGSTSVSTYVESTTGVIEGGKTGLTAVITGLFLLASVSLTPLMAVVPSAATATTLIMAGVMMMGVLKNIDFEDIAEAVPAFFTMLLMPLTGSLLIGIGFGVITYVLIHLFIGYNTKINAALVLLCILLLITLIFIPR